MGYVFFWQQKLDGADSVLSRLVCTPWKRLARVCNFELSGLLRRLIRSKVDWLGMLNSWIKTAFGNFVRSKLAFSYKQNLSAAKWKLVAILELFVSQAAFAFSTVIQLSMFYFLHFFVFVAFMIFKVWGVLTALTADTWVVVFSIFRILY